MLEENGKTEAQRKADAIGLKRQQRLADVDEARKLREQEIAKPTETAIEGLRELFHEIKIDDKIAVADAYCTEHGYDAIADLNQEQEIEEGQRVL